MSASKNQLNTPANIVTIIRILLIPVFLYILLGGSAGMSVPTPMPIGASNVRSAAALIMFVLLALTDGVDGYLARSRNEVTVFGQFIDPIADKILVVSALVGLVEINVLPAWVPLIIIVREFIISGLRMVAASHGAVVAASKLGKWKTATTLVAIILFLLFLIPAVQLSVIGSYIFTLAVIFMAIALVLTVISMIDYIKKMMPYLGETIDE